jgi:hypothetical protein
MIKLNINYFIFIIIIFLGFYYFKSNFYMIDIIIEIP